MNTIQLAFCINDKYVPQLTVVLASIMLNTQRRVKAYIFNSNLTDTSKLKLHKLRMTFKNLALEFVHVAPDTMASLKLTIPYISSETYYRYLIADMLPGTDKILYIDADTVVNGDIGPVYDMEIGENYMAGVPDLFISDIKYKPEIKFDNNELYVNAGVLLMNLEKIRDDNLGGRLFDTTAALGDKIKFQDQDIINIVCRGKICEIDSIYNYTSHNIRREKEKFRRAVIIHYTGENKPWLETSKHKMKDIYTHYQKQTEKMMNKKIKVALLIDEFFGGAGTAFGGYGALARKYIAKYLPCDDIQVDVLLGRGKNKFTPQKWHVDDVDLYRLPRKHWASRRFLRKMNYDVYLSIELTDDWVLRHEEDKSKKLILWIQDPRPWYEWREIQTMKLLPEPCYYNQPLYDYVHKLYDRKRVKFISQGFCLNDKAKDLYRLPEDIDIQYRPNPIDIDPDFAPEKHTKKDKIIFLGRVEDVKRGWIFCEIAQRMPEYEFFVLGKTNFTKQGTEAVLGKYKSIKNLHFTGHVDGDEKAQHLKDAKILVNTSIHEGVPVSFLEALSYGTVLVSNRNPDNLTSQFGIWVGNVLGDGFDKIDVYVDAIRDLMTNETKRAKLANAGRKYIEKNHNIPDFVKDVRTLIYNEVK